MQKWIIGVVISLFIITAGAETTNTWTGSVNSYIGEGGNWVSGTAPDVSDYNANMVFGTSDNYTVQGKDASGSNYSSMKAVGMEFTGSAANSYTVSAGIYRLAGTEAIVNNSSYEVTIAPYAVDLVWSAEHPSSNVRAVNGDITFNTYGTGIRLQSDNVTFHAAAGRTIELTDRSGSQIYSWNQDRTLQFRGDGTGGTFLMNGAVADGTGGEKLNLIVADAGTAVLNMTSGQFQDLTMRVGTVSFSKDSMISGDLTFDVGDSTLEFNGFDNAFSQLMVETAGTSVLDLGTGGSTLTFDDSSDLTWLGELAITNFEEGTDSIRFGTDAGGLSESQLALITVNGISGASLDPSGFLVIPEPATLGLFVIAGVGMFVARRMRTY